MTGNGFQDLLVVRCSQLGPVLQTVMANHEVDHDSHDGKSNWTGNSQMGPLAWLSWESGVSGRRIWAITSQTQKHTGLRTADALLQACGLPHFLWDGTVEVIPNPRMSLEKWTEHMSERGCV